MKRLTLFLPLLFLFASHAAFPQSFIEERYPLRAEFEYHPQLFSFTPNAVAQTDQEALQNGGDWLLTQQFPDGSYPSTVGGAPSTDSQGTTSRGMLAAHKFAQDPDHYNSAVRSGDYLINSYPRQFSDGDPDLFPLDPLFLEELTLLTGDQKYASFVQTHFWDKLANGTYGEDNDQDAGDWAENLPVYSAYSSWTAMEPAYLSLTVIAAQYTNELAARDAFMASMLDKLEAIDSSDIDGDLTGLAGAILASAHTGIDLNPQSGRWASANSTQDLINILVSYQRSGGDWPYDTGLRASRYVGDVSVTTWACMALKAWNPQTYATHISKGLAFIKSLQQASGQILTNPGAPTTTTTGVQVHAVALVAIATDDGVLLNDTNAPANQAPVAQNGNVTTNEEVAVAVALSASDADNDALTYSIVASPTKGTLTGAAPNLTYTPNANANGSDSFTFRAHDGQAYSNIATISIAINAINDAPVASHQNVTTSVNTSVPITLNATDVDNASLSYIIVSPPANGNLSGTPPAVTYTPAAGFTGSDSFTFKANDGQYDSNVATVALTISAVNPNINLALQKPATASSHSSNYTPANAVDGKTTTHWRSGSVSSSTVVWLRVDLQSSQSIGRVVVNWNGSYYAKRYQIQVSSDNVNWNTVYADNSGNGGIDNVSFTAVVARYVRVYMTRNNKSTERIYEFEVYAPTGALARFVDTNTTAPNSPAALALYQNYPNPFNPTTTIRFGLSAPRHVVLKVFNTLGQEVALLLDEKLASGTHAVRFEAGTLPSGTYFSVLQVEEERHVRRLVLMK